MHIYCWQEPTTYVLVSITKVVKEWAWASLSSCTCTVGKSPLCAGCLVSITKVVKEWAWASLSHKNWSLTYIQSNFFQNVHKYPSCTAEKFVTTMSPSVCTVCGSKLPLHTLHALGLYPFLGSYDAAKLPRSSNKAQFLLRPFYTMHC